jgi:hypothetical protein
LNVTGPARLFTVRSRSRAFTGVRFPHFGHAFAVGFSGFLRDSIAATGGGPASRFTISSAASSISDIVMPSWNFSSASRSPSSRSSSSFEYCFSPFFRIFRAMRARGSRLYGGVDLRP